MAPTNLAIAVMLALAGVLAGAWLAGPAGGVWY